MPRMNYSGYTRDEYYRAKKRKEELKRMRKSGLVGAITLGVIILVVVFVVINCCTIVPAGYVAVQYSMNGGIKDEVLTQGWHLVAPTIKTTMYTTGIEQSYLTSGDNGDSPKNESFSASSSEGKSMLIDLTFTYQFKADDVVGVFTRFKGQSGKEVRDSFIKPNIISWTKEVLALYKVSDVLGEERANVNRKLTEYLAEKFSPYGISISNVSLINIEVDADTQQAINAKITAKQNAETQQINNQTAIDKAEAEAKVKVTQAEAAAEVVRIKADAEAYEISAKAEAEAQANQQVAATLTDNLIEYTQAQNWDGKLPSTYVGSDGAIPVIQTEPAEFGFDFGEEEPETEAE